MNKRKMDTAALRALAIWGAVILAVFLVLVGGAVGAEAVYAKMYEGRIFPGVGVGGVRLDGLSKDEARKAAQKEIDFQLSKGLAFIFAGQEKRLETEVTAQGPDATRDLIRFDINSAVDKAYDLGRGGGWQRDVLEQIGALLRPVRIGTSATLDEKTLNEQLAIVFKSKIVTAQDAVFTFGIAEQKPPVISIEPEKSGMDLNAEEALKELKRQAEALAFQPIPLKETKVAPRITRQDLEPLLNEVSAYIQRPLLVFIYEKDSYTIPTSTLVELLTVEKSEKGSSLALDEARFLAALRKLALGLEQEAKNGGLDIQDGKIISFVPGTQGVEIDGPATLKPVKEEWPKKRTFPIVTKVTWGSLLGEDPETLGIREIIGVGKSNFSGSPSNRRFNIKKGASKVNGSFIAPGGEFSLLKTLGSVDGENGWLPELVIKGNKTTPEFGGGLCQIGTTTFRGALDSGLKITERRNHSYRVRYYEPAGTDATIYEPKPDFRFVNDTANHILINAYVKGDNVIFEFWGTKDGRKVDPIKPRIYNVTSPPPIKLIETTDLEPGKKKCTESAHAGADAEFTYRVTYADGTKQEEVFTSHYRPWQAVCLIGVEKLSESPLEETPAQTESPAGVN